MDSFNISESAPFGHGSMMTNSFDGYTMPMGSSTFINDTYPFDQMATSMNQKKENQNNNQNNNNNNQNSTPSSSSSYSSPSSPNDQLKDRDGEFSEDFRDYMKKDEPSSSGRKPDKQKARRTNQNIASRNYRQRKKTYIREMEDKNDSLKKDLNKIGNNPIELLRVPQEIVYLMTTVRKIVVQLDQALRNGENDMVIRNILNSWNMSMDQASALNEKEIERFVHPYTQVKLTILGYKPGSNPWTDFVMSSSHMQWWARYSDKAELTLEQNEQITNLWAKFSDDEAQLRSELIELDEKIKKFYLTKVIILPDSERLNVLSQSNIPVDDNPENDTAEIGDILEFTFNLERLKQKFIKLGRLMWDTSKQMGKFLSTRQEAVLLVLVHSNTKYIHTNMEMANNLWNQLNQNNFRNPLQQQPPQQQILHSSTSGNEMVYQQNTQVVAEVFSPPSNNTSPPTITTPTRFTAPPPAIQAEPSYQFHYYQPIQ
eukprot:gene2908-3342_t